MGEEDVVNTPSHYSAGTIECVEYLKDNMPWDAYLGGLEWNVKKYLHRWRYKKSPVEDLKKAQWYLNRMVKELSDEE
jgi:hypothetical protein